MLKLVDPADPLQSAARSQTTVAYRRLKSDLLAGRLIPGEKLKINEIALQLAVSPGAVREALSRLVPEGLVVSRDQKGFIVAPISIQDLEDLTRLRCDIEEIAIRRSIGAFDVEWETTIMTLGHRLRRTPRRLPGGEVNYGWVAMHERFHAALVSACGSARLLALHAQLYQQSERYRILSAHVEGDRDVDKEHQSLVDAAIDGDYDELIRLLREHLQQTTTLMVKAASTTEKIEA
jgi:GntR family carbon starvation induced transcriptional regulator